MLTVMKVGRATDLDNFAMVANLESTGTSYGAIARATLPYPNCIAISGILGTSVITNADSPLTLHVITSVSPFMAVVGPAYDPPTYMYNPVY